MIGRQLAARRGLDVEVMEAMLAPLAC